MPKDKDWIKKLKLNIKKELRKKKKHSPAGIKYMKSLQTKKISPTERRVRRGLTKEERKSLGI